MKTITLKNIPPRLHSRLKRRAAAHKRSLNQEALLCLEAVVCADDRHDSDFLARLDRLHASLPKLSITDTWLTAARKSGRA